VRDAREGRISEAAHCAIAGARCDTRATSLGRIHTAPVTVPVCTRAIASGIHENL
jgi:hypothetical protein